MPHDDPTEAAIRRGNTYRSAPVREAGSQDWRTPTAIGLAAAIGVPVGVFLYASAVPFGPVLVGWFIALAALSL